MSQDTQSQTYYRPCWDNRLLYLDYNQTSCRYCVDTAHIHTERVNGFGQIWCVASVCIEDDKSHGNDKK